MPIVSCAVFLSHLDWRVLSDRQVSCCGGPVRAAVLDGPDVALAASDLRGFHLKGVVS